MKILVTGANGTVGKQTVAELRRRGADVRAGVHSPERAGALRDAGATVVALDFEDAASVGAAFEGIDRALVILPFAPTIPAHGRAAARAAKAAGTSHVVRMSAVGASPDAPLELARWHAAADATFEEAGVAWTVLQPTFFQDNLLKFHTGTLRTDGAFYGASGGGATSYISSADIARVAAEVLLSADNHQNETHLLTGGEALTDEQVAEQASKAFGRQIRYIDLPAAKLAEGMRSNGAPEWMVEGLVGLEGVKSAGYAAGVTTSVEQITGRQPERYADFLARHRDALS